MDIAVDNVCKYGVFRNGQIRYMRGGNFIFSLGREVWMTGRFGRCYMIAHNGRHYTLESMVLWVNASLLLFMMVLFYIQRDGCTLHTDSLLHEESYGIRNTKGTASAMYF